MRYCVKQSKKRHIVLYMTDRNMIVTAFNNQMNEFVNDIVRILPADRDVLKLKNMIGTVRKANPKILIQLWKANITDKYIDSIERMDAKYFVEKDYTEDLTGVDDGDYALNSIERIRTYVSNMTETDQETSMKYIFNLTKLSSMYYQN